MTILQHTPHIVPFLLSEGEGTISRDNVTVTQAGTALVSGTVLGKITASGKYVAYSNAAADGSEVAAGILYAALPAATGDAKAVAITRYAEVDSAQLTGLDTPATADLRALGVIVRAATGLSATY